MSIKRILPLMMAGPSPKFTSGPNITHWSFDSFHVVGTVNKSCGIYVYAIADGSAVPSRATIKASGVSVSATAYFNIALSSLTESTAYDVYVLAEATSGSYSKVVKLDVTTAPDFNTTFGANLLFWSNGRSRSGKTLTGTWNEVVSATTSAETSSPITFTNTSGTSSTVKHNGKGLYFLNAGLVGSANKSKLNAVHQGTAFTIAFRFMPIVGSTTSIQPIINNNNMTSGKTGFGLAYWNVSPRTHALLFEVSKSSAGNFNFNIAIDNFFSPRTYTTGVIKFDGTTLTIYKNGTVVNTYSASNLPFAATDASDDIVMGKFSTSGTYVTDCFTNEIVITNTALSDSDRGLVETKLSTYNSDLGTNGKANIYGMFGQSNMAGSPTSPSSYLTGAMKTFIWSLTDDGTTISSNQLPRVLEMGVSQNTENTSAFGPELEFGYRMAEQLPNVTFLSKYAVSATALDAAATNPDWNVATGGTDCAAMSRIQFYHMFRYCRYVLDRDIDVRGWLFSLGETDAIAGNASYETDLGNLLKYHIDYLVSEFAYNPAKMKVNVSLIDQVFSGTPRPFAADIIAAQQAFVNDFLTDNPSYSTKVSTFAYHSKNDLALSDGTHLTMLSMIEEGNRFFQYFKTHIND